MFFHKRQQGAFWRKGRRAAAATRIILAWRRGLIPQTGFVAFVPGRQQQGGEARGSSLAESGQGRIFHFVVAPQNPGEWEIVTALDVRPHSAGADIQDAGFELIGVDNRNR